MLSQTYQMSTRWNEHAASVDPENRFLWRMPRRRLDAEELRDSILSVSGTSRLERWAGTLLQTTPFQDLSAGGVSRSPALYRVDPAKRLSARAAGSPVRSLSRRSIFPTRRSSNGDRAVTTVASQALFMMNSGIVEQASGKPGGESCWAMAGAIPSATGSDARAGVCFGRPGQRRRKSSYGRAFLDRYQTTAASLAGQDPDDRRRLRLAGALPRAAVFQ